MSNKPSKPIMLFDCKTSQNVIGKEKFLNWLCEFEYGMFGIPKPDKVFFLNIPPDVSKKLMENRDNKFSHTNTNFIFSFVSIYSFDSFFTS